MQAMPKTDAARPPYVAELEGYKFEDLKVGMRATVSRTITETDLRNFSGVSGDTNPMHLSEEYAEHTPFKGCIVHGMLTASLISAVLGTKLPGPGCVYMSQTLKFTAPVRIRDTVFATSIVKSLRPEKSHAIFTTQCFVKGKLVIDGEALIKVPSRNG
jgi:3-hydroxybutyryl-CoA dehydratase